MERAVRHRAVAEERHCHTAVVAQLRRGRGPRRDRQTGTDDAVGAEDAERRIGDVHRATAPAVRALVLAHQFREHPEWVETLREAMPVAAMSRRDDVGRLEGPTRADGRRFLSDRQVHEARHFAVAVQHRDALLEAPDDEHPPLHLEELLVSEHEARTVPVGTTREDALTCEHMFV